MKLTLEEIRFLLDRAYRTSSYQSGGSIAGNAVFKLEREKHRLEDLILKEEK